jgi:hypothetical protein
MHGHTGDAYGMASNMYFNKRTGDGFVFAMNGALYGYGRTSSSAFNKVEYLIHQALWNNIMSKKRLHSRIRKARK